MRKKYIVEIEDKPFHKEDGDFLYRVKGFNSLVFDMTGIGKLTPYTEPDLEQVRKEGYKEGREAGIKDGKCEAWEAARKIIHMPEGDLLNIFTECYSAVCTALQVILKYDASEAIEKIRQYEQEQEESKAVLDMNSNLRRIPVLINGTEYYAYVSSITQKKTDLSIAGTDLFTAKIELTAPFIPFISR